MQIRKKHDVSNMPAFEIFDTLTAHFLQFNFSMKLSLSTGKIFTDILNRYTFVFRVMQSKSGLLLELSESNIQEDLNIHA
jgi:hypothetical protein